LAAYGPALSSGDPAVLAEAIERTIFGAGEVSSSAQLLAAYALAAADRLGDQDEAAIVGRGPDFPDVGQFVVGEGR
jgi:hypothetical protein